MQSFSSDLTTSYKYRVISISSHSKVLLFKESEKLYYRSGLFINVSPLQIPSLHPLIELFTDPSQLTLLTFPLKIDQQEAFVLCLFLDTDLADCPKQDYNEFLTASLKFHQQQLDLLQKNIAIKDFTTKTMSRKQLADLSLGLVSKQVKKKYSFLLEFKKEKDLFRKAIFSSNKIKQIDIKKDSIIPESTILLGKTISNKDIGINSPAIFLTGKKESRRTIVSTIINHLTADPNHHIVIFDFGLSVSLEKTFYRQFNFDDIHFDPFSFCDSLAPSQYALFISHLSFIGKNILKLNDRQISIFEEKLASYLQQTTSDYSWKNFVAFTQDELADESLTSPLTIGSFSDDAASSDFTSSLKAVESPLKSNDFETLLNKIRYLEYLFAQADRSSFPEIFFKNHIDVFTISSTPDLKSLSFYLFNLFYTLNQPQYHQFTFMFLDIDSILFDKFNDLTISWIHPDLRQSLFDASDIFAVKKIFTLLETRIYTSYSANAPYQLLSKSTKEAIDKLQFLHDYCLLESPTLQRQEFFTITQAASTPIDLPTLNLFVLLVKVFFSGLPEFSYRQLFALYDVRYSSLKKCLKSSYLRKKGKTYILTEKANRLKKVIIDFLAYQPPLTLEESEIIIQYSDPLKYNLLFHDSFAFGGNIESLCTRYLSSQFTATRQLNGVLVYQFLAYKKHLLEDAKLFYYFLVALQSTEGTSSTVTHPPETPPPIAIPDEPSVLEDTDTTLPDTSNDTSQSKIEVMSKYINTIKTVIAEDPELTDNATSGPAITPATASTLSLHLPEQIQVDVDSINKRITEYLPGKGISFPDHPIFLVLKFLDSNVSELIQADITNLINSANSTST